MPQTNFDLNLTSFRELLLEMTQKQSIDELSQFITSSLASTDKVALARVWLVAPGDKCNTCNKNTICPDKNYCLHLLASNGNSVDSVTAWDNVDHSSFKRFPIGTRRVGRIASSGLPSVSSIISNRSDWVADWDWVQKEHIAGFVGEPLICNGKVLGVLAFFTRTDVNAEILELMHMVANHLAYEITNAYARTEIKRLKSQIEPENSFKQYKQYKQFASAPTDHIIGKSNALRHVLRQADLVAPVDTSVLITGESGTGKELIARKIHAASKRAGQPMIKINCAAISKNLFESEFFGHARGAFTGAHRDRKGFLEIAHRGTLFLDEISEIPLELQGKLLRVLQEGEYRRVGEEKIRKADVRIIAATNRDLKEEVRAGYFREDIYYRLNVFPLLLPPLRDRREDIPMLVDHFLMFFARRHHRSRPDLTRDDIDFLTQYQWPGNIRELQNIMERIVISSPLGKPELTVACLVQPDIADPSRIESQSRIDPCEVLTDAQMRRLEKENTVKALMACQGRIYGTDGAAQLMGLKPTTLMSRLKRMGIAPGDWRTRN